jgi:hypothetical protein
MSLAIEKTQQLEFVSQVLPALFHNTPVQFIGFLARDGNKFLKFYWDQAGKHLGDGLPEGSFGLNYDIRKPNPQTTVVLVILPAPQVPGESYFAGLIFRPLRMPSLFRPAEPTQVITLDAPDLGDPACRPVLAEWTRRLGRHEIGPGPQPHLEEFYQAVLGMLH